MIPCDFEGSTRVLDKPPELTREQCSPLNVQIAAWGDYIIYQTCWKVTKDELEEIQKTGRVWVMVVGGQPPMQVSGTRLI